MRLPLFTAVLAATLAAAAAAHAAPPSDQNDPYLWLEDAHGARAMSWVGAENAKTLGVLEKDPRYPALYADALKIAEAKDRIPTPRIIGGDIYNFWQDADHVRGVWRKTTLADYRTADPHWTPVLDLDALSTAEKANWFIKGEDCQEPAERRCLISLSDGGEDAVTVREFDLASQSFVAGGFAIPSGKQSSAWETPDSILAVREWTPGELTASGYPYVVKRLLRGQPLSAATEVFRGKPSDVEVDAQSFTNAAGRTATFIQRGVTFFESEVYLVTPNGAVKLALPPKMQLHDLVGDRMTVSLNQDWSTDGKTFAQGSLVALNLDALASDPAHLKPTLIYQPGPRDSLDQAAATTDRLIVTTLDNVRGRAFVYTPVAGGGWTRVKLDLPDNATIGIVDADSRSNQAFISVTGFLTPSTVSLLDAHTGALSVVKALPAKFDASKDQVDQYEATSKDGTKVPYFIVHPKGMKLDGTNPTILNAYGGFQVSETPNYSGNIGKLWLERGGVFVLANIRGGGEFGPAWHEAGLKTKRQVIYDDFAGVAEDLIARKITSPRRLGIMGGSNGGLLMGVEFTERPDLWHAVDIQVPLLDMLRFEKIAAGTSWVGEYGSVSVPEERAFLEKISPYNNLRPGVAYPEPFIWTTTKDDRVGPQHARKFAAKLGAMGYPYMFYEVTEGGHGSGANLKEKAKTNALEYTYFTRKLMD